jgi:3-oxoacyl-(acyl-carrier-protein) synthase
MASVHETRNADERVVIVGLGVLAPTPNGETVDGFWDDVTNDRHGFRLIPDLVGPYGDDVESRGGAPLAPFELKELLLRHGFSIGDDKELRRNQKMSHKTAQGVVYAGAQALRQAGILSPDSLSINERLLRPEHFSLYQGTGIGGTLTLIEVQRMLDERAGVFDEKRAELANLVIEQLALKATEGRVDEEVIADLRKFLAEEAKSDKPGHASYAYSLLELLPGRVDELATKTFKARGFNDTYGTECAASLSAFNQAVEHIRNGKYLVGLAGGVEMAAHSSTMWAFEQLKAVDTGNDPLKIPRPFDLDRRGLGFGEGVAEVVVARLDWVLRMQKMGHKITILAEVLGTGASSDAHHDSFPSDEGPGRALDEALADSGYEARELYDTLVEAHEPGTAGGVKEIETITSRFKPKKLVGIVSIKSLIGHSFGAAGAFGIVSGVKSILTKTIHPNRNLDNPIPETDGYPMVPNKAQRVKNVRFAIINSFGFGGKNRVAIIGKWLGVNRPPRASKLKRVELDSYER